MGKKSYKKALKKGDQSLRVTDDVIKTLNNVNFDELKDLKGITFLRCRIEDMGNEFLKVHSMELLSLAENEIKEIPSALNALKFLVFINFSMNKISKLPTGLFNSMKSVTILDLSFNKLSHASDISVISNMTSLKALYLSDNNFIDIGADIGNLVNLEVLSLRNNEITSLPNAIGSNLLSLKELYVQDNKLTYLPPNLVNTSISPNGKLMAYNNPWKINDLDASLKKPLILLFNYFHSEAYKNNVNALVMNGFNIFE